MYKVAVEYAYVERTMVVDSGYTVFGLNAVSALVQVLRILVLTGVVYAPAVLGVKLVNCLPCGEPDQRETVSAG